MDQVVAVLPVAAGVFAVPQFVPQLLRVRRGSTAGVSWTWAALTCINNAAWIVYFALSDLYGALIPAAAAVIFSGLLAAQLARMHDLRRRSLMLVMAWTVALTTAGIAFGTAGLGTALVAAFVLQIAPSVWTAYRSTDISGISVGTWSLIFGELACFGLYGLARSDLHLTLLGATGVAASILMLTRVAITRMRSRNSASQKVAQASPGDDSADIPSRSANSQTRSAARPSDSVTACQATN